MPHDFDPVILRQYDIRGRFGDNLTAADSAALGGWLAEEAIAAGVPTAVVGRDARLSSPPLYDAMVEAMAAGGLAVRGIGDCATPEVYFAERHLQAGVAVMVTGSHNPPDDNGFKIGLAGKPFFGDDILRLAQKAAAADPKQRAGGTITHESLRDSYVGYLRREFAALPPLRVAFDPANGALCWALQALLPHLPGQVHVINGTADGRFPAHHPDPTVAENLQQLKKLVTEKQCDFGIAFDGDGDRIGVIDDKGDIVWGDSLIPIYAAAILSRNKGAVIHADVKAGGSVFANIEKLGGKPQMTPAGHSIIKQAMKKSGALLAGEMTGHIFFADNGGYDDALYAALRLWEIIGAGEALSELRKKYPIDLSIQEVRIPIEEERKFSVIGDIKAYAVSHYGAENITDIDGVRVSFKSEGGEGEGEGWWLVRAANTENALSVRAAGSDEKTLLEAQEKLREVLQEFALPHDKF